MIMEQADIRLEKMLDRLPLPTIEKNKILELVDEIVQNAIKQHDWERSLVDG